MVFIANELLIEKLEFERRNEHGYYGVDSKREYISEYVSTSDMDLYVRKNFKNKVWDAEADLYTVTVAGLNFSFKLDENDNPNIFQNM